MTRFLAVVAGAVAVAAIAVYWIYGGGLQAVRSEPLVEGACAKIDDDVMVLTFVNEKGSSRRISFSSKGRFSAVYLGYWTDIAVDWNRIVAVRTRPYRQGDSVRFVVEFASETKIRPARFEFGFIKRSCLDDLKARYGEHLKFIDVAI